MFRLILLIGIAIVVMGSALWNPGGIFLLDFLIGEHGSIAWYEPLSQILLVLIGKIFGYALGSKMVILLIILLSGYLGILLSRILGQRFKLEEKKNQKILDVIGALFFVMNPFAYERMLTQPLIYAGIISIGYGLYWSLFARQYLRAGFAYAIAICIFPHASYMVLLAAVLTILLLKCELSRGKVFIQMVLPILIINFNWMSSATVGKITDTIHSFSSDNFIAFTTQALSPLDVFSTNLLLYGFWGEKYDNHFAIITDISPYWYVAGMFIFLSVMIGFFQLWKHDMKREFLIVIILGTLSLIFAVGEGSIATAKIAQFMIDAIPYWQGYREPQKWTGIIFLFEAVGCISCLAFFLKKWGNDNSTRLSILLCTVTIIYIWSPGVLFSYRGQMQTTQIPIEFLVVRHMLEEKTDTKQILVLPWYGYIGCDWISRPTIANPAGRIFEGLPALVADTIEVGEMLSSKNQDSAGVQPSTEKLIPKSLEQNTGENIGYIITMNTCSGYDDIKEKIGEGEGGILRKLYESQSVNLYKYVQ